MRRSRSVARASALASVRGLAWFGIAAGLVELLAGPRLARAVGFPDRGRTVRFAGLRRAGAGVGLLTSHHPEPWLWLRVAGNGLRMLILATRLDGPRRGGAAAAIAALAAVAAVDAACARRLAQTPGTDDDETTPLSPHGDGADAGSDHAASGGAEPHRRAATVRRSAG